MSVKLLFTPSAQKDLKKIDGAIKNRIQKKLLVFAKSPLKYSSKLIDSKIGQYRWRVGNYRIAFDIKGNDVIILRVRHRREIYK